MKKFLGFVLAILLISVTAAQAATMVGGRVAYVKSGCDYYIVSDNNGYDLLEWYGGHSPVVGDVLAGEIHSFGFKDIYIGSSATTATKGRVWVEDYLLSADSVVSKFKDKCYLNTPSTVSTYSSSYTSPTYTSPYSSTYSYPSYYGTSSTASTLSNNNYYTNVYGNTVHSPAYSTSIPSSASAQCADGTYSFSQSRSGTCSHHGGVASWY